jgi:hypothetical protein
VIWPRLSGPGTRIRAGLSVLICCCASLAACTAAPRPGPAVSVTTPAVGRPPAPASVQAALSGEAFTPYAGLGASTDDGLAPGDTYTALHTACMNTAGYGSYASSSPLAIRANQGLAFALPYGPWGYLGSAQAAEQGFIAGDGPGAGEPDQPAPAASLPAAVQTAAGKCLNIVLEFNNAQFTHALAVIETMNDDIVNDVVADPAVRTAKHAWAGCIARHGYTVTDPVALADQQLAAAGLGAGPARPVASPSPSAAQSQAQVAAAVADAACTASADLAGIYFAVQASYEQQLVSANQQRLDHAVRQYQKAFAAELRKLPALLRTASATPLLHSSPVQPASGQPPAR